MKRTALFFVAALAAIAVVPAQGIRQGEGAFPGMRQFTPPAPAAAEKVAVTGALSIVRGTIAVSSEGITYLTAGLDRYIGFIDGFKEGATVALEGTAASFPQDDKTKILRVNKMTFNGKEYDLARPGAEWRNNAQGQSWSPGMHGCPYGSMYDWNNQQKHRGRRR
jgi:hypothetical protein